MKIPMRFLTHSKNLTRLASLIGCMALTLLFPACASHAQYQKGYDRGSSDTVKRQYWILQEMQKTNPPQKSHPRLSVYHLTVTPDPNATVKSVPYDIGIPIQQ